MVEESFPNVNLIHAGGNLGFAKANNLAKWRVRAPLVLFLNPDTEVRKGTLKAMTDIFREDRAVAAVGCKIRDEHGVIQDLPSQWRLSAVHIGVEMVFLSDFTMNVIRKIIPHHDPEISGHVSRLYGACLMVDRQILDDIGWFDERFFMYCEDVDLCHRIGLKGRRLYYTADHEIMHLIGGASRKEPSTRSYLIMLEARKKLLEKYYGYIGILYFKSIVFINAHLRLFLLSIFMMVMVVLKIESKTIRKGACGRYVQAIRWCVKSRCPDSGISSGV
jgi:GT2 family glycosyltransferase